MYIHALPLAATDLTLYTYCHTSVLTLMPDVLAALYLHDCV